MSFFTKLRDTVLSVGAVAVGATTGINLASSLPKSVTGAGQQQVAQAAASSPAAPAVVNKPPAENSAAAMFGGFSSSPYFFPIMALLSVGGIILIVKATK